jgi:hypothetical protein
MAGHEKPAETPSDKRKAEEARAYLAATAGHLTALRDCVRLRRLGIVPGGSAAGDRAPWKRSKVAWLLKEVFAGPPGGGGFSGGFSGGSGDGDGGGGSRLCSTVVLCCVSPLARDLPHTAASLRFAQSLLADPLAPPRPAAPLAVDPEDPCLWDSPTALRFVAAAARAHGDYAVAGLPPEVLPPRRRRTAASAAAAAAAAGPGEDWAPWPEDEDEAAAAAAAAAEAPTGPPLDVAALCGGGGGAALLRASGPVEWASRVQAQVPGRDGVSLARALYGALWTKVGVAKGRRRNPDGTLVPLPKPDA